MRKIWDSICSIWEGWSLYLVYLLGYEDYEITRMASQRKAICKKCEHKKYCILGDKCGKCGCVIEAKIRCYDCVCPDARW